MKRIEKIRNLEKILKEMKTDLEQKRRSPYMEYLAILGTLADDGEIKLLQEYTEKMNRLLKKYHNPIGMWYPKNNSLTGENP